jgi:hypothetical protein
LSFEIWIPLRFPHKTMFGSSLPPVVCRSAHVLLTLFVFVCAQWCLTHIVSCLCFVFVSLDCSFCLSTRKHYSEFDPTSICSYSTILRVLRRSSKYQFCNLCFEPIGHRTHDQGDSIFIIDPVFVFWNTTLYARGRQPVLAPDYQLLVMSCCSLAPSVLSNVYLKQLTKYYVKGSTWVDVSIVTEKRAVHR